MNRNNKFLRQEEMLKAATSIFAKEDFHKVTMEEVAKKAGVGKGTIYRYYKNKEDLYFSIISRGLETLYRYISRLVSREKDTLSKLRRVIFCALRFFELNKSFVKVFLQEEVKFKTMGYEECKENLSKSIDLVEELILKGQEEGVLKEINVSQAASLLIGMAKELFLREIEASSGLSLSKNVELISEIFFFGVAREIPESSYI